MARSLDYVAISEGWDYSTVDRMLINGSTLSLVVVVAKGKKWQRVVFVVEFTAIS